MDSILARGKSVGKVPDKEPFVQPAILEQLKNSCRANRTIPGIDFGFPEDQFPGRSIEDVPVVIKAETGALVAGHRRSELGIPVTTIGSNVTGG
jgi:hypothetical protein